METQKTVDMKGSVEVRMKSITDPKDVHRGDLIYYFRVYETAWNRAVVVKESDLYLTLMAIDHGFKGITWHVRRSSLLEPADYLIDSF